MAFEQDHEMGEQEIEFKGFKAYPDGSGAPVTVNVFGNVYSFDFLGELKTHGIRIRPAYGNRARGMRDSGLAQAKKTYLQKIKKLGPEWLQKNLEMYPGGEGLGKISFAAIREWKGGAGVMNPRKAFEQALGKQAASKTASESGRNIFYRIVPQDDANDLYERLEKEDAQSAELFLDIIYAIQKQLDISSGAEEALRRVIGAVEHRRSWDAALLRNNIFKAANSLGMKLPSHFF